MSNPTIFEREEKTIESMKKILEDQKNRDTALIVEFESLFDEYINIFKQFKSVIRLNDKQLKRLNKVLEEVDTARKQVDAAKRGKSRFLEGMSEKALAPMNEILGFTDIMLNTHLNEEQADYVKTVKRSSVSLLALLNDILDLSKIDAGIMDFKEIEFDPELLAYDVCARIHPKIESKPIDLLCRIDHRLPSNVKGDPLRLRQVMTNLMGNALKFADSGSIELSLHVESKTDTRVKLHAMIGGTDVAIPKDELNGLFEPVDEVHGSIHLAFEGPGLALSICKKIARLMGGDVWAESDVNKGSTYHFTAWLQKAEEKKGVRFRSVSLSTKKALIVDEDRTTLDILMRTLKSFGMDVIGIINPQEVILTLQEALEGNAPFDLCMADTDLPAMSGYEVAKQIRDPKNAFSDLPLIAMSSSLERDARKCEQAGFDGFLSKPIQREKLLQMLQRIMGEWEQGKKHGLGGHKIMTQYSVREDEKHAVRILVAGDDPEDQQFTEMILTRAGYSVEIARNGKEAVEKYTACSRKFDLIIMDDDMPEMNGIQATRAIRDWEMSSVPEAGRAGRIPIIAMAAQGAKEDRERFLDAGIDDFIPKPMSREKVFEALEKWVFNKQG